MEWLVIDAIFLRTTGCYALILQSAKLKMFAEVTSVIPIKTGDRLYPVKDAIYLLNRNAQHKVKAVSAGEFSGAQWLSLKALTQTVTA